MLLSCSLLNAQNVPSGGFDTNKFGSGKFGLPSIPSPLSDEPAQLSASFDLAPAGDTGTVSVTVSLESGWHVYATTQPPGGPLPTKITVASPEIELTGPFTSDSLPHISQNEAWPGVPIEELSDRVTWSAPFKVKSKIDAGAFQLKLNFDGLACTAAGRCVPVEEELVANSGSSDAPPPPGAISAPRSLKTPLPSKLFASGSESSTSQASSSKAPSSAQRFQAEDSHATLVGWLEPGVVQPGSTAHVFIQLSPEAGYHLYPFIADEADTSFRTLIVPTEKSGLQLGLPQTDAALVSSELDPKYKEHTAAVIWKIPVRVPEDASNGAHKLQFVLGYQTCTNRSCDPPVGATLTGELTVSSSPTTTGPIVLTGSESEFRAAAAQPKLGTWNDFDSGIGDAQGSEIASERSGVPGKSNTSSGDKSIAGSAASGDIEPEQASLTLVSLCLALIGGVILNFMPCVLPVIGLKVMGFVEQSGSNRSEIIKLNLAYVFGILAVMWSLATITVMLGNAFGWGEQFTYLEFKVFLAALVLAMALSFLGVWEIPIPGFATSYKSNKMMQREGVLGAFSKGLLTTILATPCSGPFLGVVFGLTLTLSPFGVFAIYTAVGLGMGLPFLLLCIWPDVIRVLPKPGAWMETLKEVLAFPLLLTVVYMVAAISSEYRVATLSALIAVWFACWIVGKVPAYEATSMKAKAWATGLSTVAVWTVASFYFFGPIDSKLPWQPYTPEGLTALRGSGKTVMVDFTANWCLNCQVNTRVAIERPAVAEVVRKNGVAPMLADWTDRSPVIRKQLAELNSKQIPLLAIFPADPNAEPIVLRDLITEQMLVDALEAAGPSRSSARVAVTPAPVTLKH